MLDIMRQFLGALRYCGTGSFMSWSASSIILCSIVGNSGLANSNHGYSIVSIAGARWVYWVIA
jgi:hypothetical protein